MKLSNLVKLRNNLQNINASSARLSIEEFDGHISNQLNIPMHLTYTDDINRYVHKLDSIQDLLDQIENDIPALIEKIQQEIDDLTKDFYQRGYMLNGFYGSNSTDVPTERLARILQISDQTRGEVIVKARGYTSWHYPVLEIGPGDGQWTEHLVAGDPLYIVDVHREFLDTTLSKFNEVYKNRIRPYLLKSNGGPEAFTLEQLPQNQFGFVFAWNVFNYFPYNETKCYLQEIMKVLRPGGVAMFSYNNCDSVPCVEFVEMGFRSWMPQKLLTDLCKELGFEIIATRNTEDLQWIEIKRPGELHTVKGHQVLGKIEHYDGSPPKIPQKSLDMLGPKMYTKEQFDDLKLQALHLGVDTSERIYGGAFTPEQLEILINLRKNQ